MTTPQELKQIVSEGLLSFPVTDFDANGERHGRILLAHA
jgi:5-dehydro-4-deoxyglucarate dehydratase